ncbi:hypothetical protein BCR41DRAFT_351460 [Lobosporangium transversale]|uniref:Uncharacterized protein n=1 Tax=Lobosporangium transversale TaxID=64571 RepID=A0A1Y2GQA6_9FUNG|nr:hypothetical protein BCR41DRAFT_351460 [Lobosporangium transversale]ORZ19065.1 hypothetical protein BCR41DRAFT_351460 [Lobosporangium transversale]|eukprot:XP_021882233.1 hypothetical protein BCR41DRAFT_351460 [Lobosporangium transversale]
MLYFTFCHPPFIVFLYFFSPAYSELRFFLSRHFFFYNYASILNHCIYISLSHLSSYKLFDFLISFIPVICSKRSED